MANKFTEYKATDTGLIFAIDWQEKQRYEKAKIAEAFETYGGSFTKAIWIALYRADRINTIKILETWEGMVKEYILTFIIPRKNG